MRVVLDTNVLLVCISKKSPYRPIFDALLNGDIEIVITNEILSEYVEILERLTNEVVAKNIAELLLNLPNVRKIDVYYKWNMIKDDFDDNKFVDCAIAGRVKFIVSSDKHFKILKKIPFPKVELLGIKEFLAELKINQ